MAQPKDAIGGSERSGAQDELFSHPGHLIRRLNQISVSIFLHEAKKYDLTQLQYVSLVVIDSLPGIDQSRLGRAVALDRQTVSTVVHKLIDKGLVRRESRNRKTGALYVTGSGRALYHAMRDRLSVVDEKLLQPLSAPERAVFLSQLARLVTELNVYSRAPQTRIEELNLRPMTKQPAKVNGRKASAVRRGADFAD